MKENFYEQPHYRLCIQQYVMSFFDSRVKMKNLLRLNNNFNI